MTETDQLRHALLLTTTALALMLRESGHHPYRDTVLTLMEHNQKLIEATTGAKDHDA